MDVISCDESLTSLAGTNIELLSNTFKARWIYWYSQQMRFPWLFSRSLSLPTLSSIRVSDKRRKNAIPLYAYQTLMYFSYWDDVLRPRITSLVSCFMYFLTLAELRGYVRKIHYVHELHACLFRFCHTMLLKQKHEMSTSYLCLEQTSNA